MCLVEVARQPSELGEPAWALLGKAAEPLEAHDPLERLRPESERVDAAAMELPFGDAEAFA